MADVEEQLQEALNRLALTRSVIKDAVFLGAVLSFVLGCASALMSIHLIPLVPEHATQCGEPCLCQLHKHCNAWSQSCNPFDCCTVTFVSVHVHTLQNIQKTLMGPIPAVQQASHTAYIYAVHTSEFISQEASERTT